MRSLGIVRKIDELGRIVIPKEIRKTLKLEVGTPLEILADTNNIMLRKYSCGCSHCGFDGVVAELGSIKLCAECVGKIAVNSANKKFLFG